MGGAPTEYGLWPLVVVNSGALILFALSFTRPKTGRDWRSMGAFSAFLVALGRRGRSGGIGRFQGVRSDPARVTPGHTVERLSASEP